MPPQKFPLQMNWGLDLLLPGRLSITRIRDGCSRNFGPWGVHVWQVLIILWILLVLGLSCFPGVFPKPTLPKGSLRCSCWWFGRLNEITPIPQVDAWVSIIICCGCFLLPKWFEPMGKWDHQGCCGIQTGGIYIGRPWHIVTPIRNRWFLIDENSRKSVHIQDLSKRHGCSSRSGRSTKWHWLRCM